MKYLKISLFFLFLPFISCAQNEQMGKDKLVNLYKEVKTYEYNPRYWIDFEATHCSYEILLNDVPLQSYFKNTKISGSSIPLNSRILSKGKQKLTLKIYPYIDGTTPEPALTSDSKFSLSITYGEFGKEKVKDYHKVTSFTTTSLNNIPYYEKIIYFEADVPYSLVGWTNSVDLDKEDKKELQKEVENIYKEFANYYTNQDVDQLYNKYYRREKEIAQSLFLNKKTDSEELVKKIEKQTTEILPFELENYEINFYAEGRIVGLTRIDIKYKGKSALIFEDEKKFRILSLLLHRPKQGAPLEVIR